MGLTDSDIFHDLGLNFELIDGWIQTRKYEVLSIKKIYSLDTNIKFHLQDRTEDHKAGAYKFYSISTTIRIDAPGPPRSGPTKPIV